MCAAGPTPIDALRPAVTGAGIDVAHHGQDRCSLAGRSLQWQPPNGGVPGQRRHPDQPRSSAKPHAPPEFDMRLTRSHELRFQETRRSDSPVWWTSSKSRQRTRSGRPISPPSRCRKDSSTWWRSWICSPETCSAGSLRSPLLPRSGTALTRNSVCRHWKRPSVVVVSQRSSIPTRAANSPLLISWRDCKQRKSRSAGQAESAATTTSWWRDYGEPSNRRRCICMPTTMAGRLKSIWPASFGGTAM